jgi:hypothetical protein
MARRGKDLPHIDEREVSLQTTIVFDVTGLRIHRQILPHLFVRAEMDLIESRAAPFTFGKHEDTQAHPFALMGGVNGNVVDEKPLLTFSRVTKRSRVITTRSNPSGETGWKRAGLL